MKHLPKMIIWFQRRSLKRGGPYNKTGPLSEFISVPSFRVVRTNNVSVEMLLIKMSVRLWLGLALTWNVVAGNEGKNSMFIFCSTSLELASTRFNQQFLAIVRFPQTSIVW